MQYPYYTFSVPVFIKTLGGLKTVIAKATALSTTVPGGEQAILNTALAPDMFPFKRQVQIACDNAKAAAARLAQVDVPSFPDTEESLEELNARIDKVIAFLKTFKVEQVAHAEAVRVQLAYFPKKFMQGDAYFREYALPNFYFHVTTAYDIIRSLGAPLGKEDFINGLPLQDV